jgi:hypothetical protein
MTTVDDALTQHTRGDTLPPSAPSSASRGRLSVTERAARHLVQGVVEHAPLLVRNVDVHIADLDDAGLSGDVHLAAEYPHTELATALEAFRRHVTQDIQRLLGRPLRRLDVTITDLLVDLAPTRRVQ